MLNLNNSYCSYDTIVVIMDRATVCAVYFWRKIRMREVIVGVWCGALVIFGEVNHGVLCPVG